MKKTIQNYKNDQFEIDTYFVQEFKGRGGWNINCEVSFHGEKKVFHHYITDSQFIDEISDLKEDNASFETIQNAYCNKSFDSLEEVILDWCEEVNEGENAR